MGHDFHAYLDNKEISYLRKSMGNLTAREVYKCLKSEKYDNDVSGNGSYKLFSKKQILKAIEEISYLIKKEQDCFDHKDTLRFFEEILKSMKNNDKVRINFL